MYLIRVFVCAQTFKLAVMVSSLRILILKRIDISLEIIHLGLQRLEVLLGLLRLMRHSKHNWRDDLAAHRSVLLLLRNHADN